MNVVARVYGLLALESGDKQTWSPGNKREEMVGRFN